jgi:hypothetical protein
MELFGVLQFRKGLNGIRLCWATSSPRSVARACFPGASATCRGRDSPAYGSPVIPAMDPCDRGTSASRFHHTPRLCAVCATRPPRRSPAATCRRQRRLHLKARGAGGSIVFSSRRRARHLILCGATAPGRAEAEQGVTAPCPRHRCRQGQSRRGAKPAVPAERAASPSTPIASPATRGPRGAAGCRTSGAAAAGLGRARRRRPSATSQARDPPHIGP